MFSVCVILDQQPNISDTHYKKSITGEDFIADKVAPDPSTQKPSVQIAVAVKDGVTVVGVLHASVE